MGRTSNNPKVSSFTAKPQNPMKTYHVSALVPDSKITFSYLFIVKSRSINQCLMGHNLQKAIISTQIFLGEKEVIFLKSRWYQRFSESDNLLACSRVSIHLTNCFQFPFSTPTILNNEHLCSEWWPLRYCKIFEHQIYTLGYIYREKSRLTCVREIFSITFE